MRELQQSAPTILIIQQRSPLTPNPSSMTSADLGTLTHFKDNRTVSELSVCPPVCPSVRPFINPSIRPFIRPSIHPSLCLSVRLSFGPSVHPSVRHSVRPSVTPSARPSVRPSIRLFVRPSVGLSFYSSIRPSVRHSVRPSVTPSARPSVRSSVRPSICPSVRSSVRHSVRPPVTPFVRSSYHLPVHHFAIQLVIVSDVCRLSASHKQPVPSYALGVESTRHRPQQLDLQYSLPLAQQNDGLGFDRCRNRVRYSGLTTAASERGTRV